MDKLNGKQWKIPAVVIEIEFFIVFQTFDAKRKELNFRKSFLFPIIV